MTHPKDLKDDTWQRAPANLAQPEAPMPLLLSLTQGAVQRHHSEQQHFKFSRQHTRALHENMTGILAPSSAHPYTNGLALSSSLRPTYIKLVSDDTCMRLEAKAEQPSATMSPYSRLTFQTRSQQQEQEHQPSLHKHTFATHPPRITQVYPKQERVALQSLPVPWWCHTIQTHAADLNTDFKPASEGTW
jgi:hypothetical protein